ncbi:MAG: exodeoxyribonuclease VII large subunit, partial [Pseudomonadota bacterium]
PERLLETKRQRFDTVADRLPRALQTQVERRRARLDAIGAGLVSPKQIVREKQGKLETLASRLGAGLSQAAAKKRIAFARSASRLRPEPLVSDARRARKALSDTARRARPALDRILAGKQRAFASEEKMLETLSYQATLKRGYAIVRDTNGKVLRTINQVANEREVGLTLADGQINLSPTGEAAKTPKPKPPKPAQKKDGSDQGSLF